MKKYQKDVTAAATIRLLRLNEGMSPERLSTAIQRRGAGGATMATISPRTIRRIEETAAIPSPRIQYTIARYFHTVPSEIWEQPHAKNPQTIKQEAITHV